MTLERLARDGILIGVVTFGLRLFHIEVTWAGVFSCLLLGLGFGAIDAWRKP